MKLHGEALETRADFSLDDPPTQVDLHNFAHYVRGSSSSSSSKHRKPHIPSQLLVLGYSGSDERVVLLLKHALDTDPDVRIFWVCYNDSDLARVRTLFFESDYAKRVIVHKTSRPDLLLYELYQELTLSLPGGGFAYEFTHKVPPDGSPIAQLRLDATRVSLLQCSLDSERELLAQARRLASDMPNSIFQAKLFAREAISLAVGKEIANLMESLPKPGNAPDIGLLNRYASLSFNSPLKNKQGKLLLDERSSDPASDQRIIIADLTTGSASALHEAFNILSLKRWYSSVWLELQDYDSPLAVAQEALREISLRLGLFQLEHVTLIPPELDQLFRERTQKRRERTQKRELTRQKLYEGLVTHLKGLIKYFNIDPQKWVLFLYARNGMGTCSGWFNNSWNKDEVDDLRIIMRAFAEAEFRLIYAPLTKARLDRDCEKNRIIKDEVNKIERRNKKERPQEARDAPVEAIETDSHFPYQKTDVFDDFVPAGDEEFLGSKDLSVYRDIIGQCRMDWLRCPEPNATDGDILEFRRRLQFLYAITLFRQSRHTSAFFSEAVYSCPNVGVHSSLASAQRGASA